LQSEIIEIATAQVGQRRPSAIDLEAGCSQEKLVQTGDRLVVTPARAPQVRDP
jgi:hypothetical protein